MLLVASNGLAPRTPLSGPRLRPGCVAARAAQPSPSAPFQAEPWPSGWDPKAAQGPVPTAAPSRGGWDQLIAAMRLYHERYGDLCIELGWRVPSCPPWPESLWDQKLAKTIYHIDFWQQFVAAVPSRRAELDEIGFLWSRLQPEYVIGLRQWSPLPASSLTPLFRLQVQLGPRSSHGLPRGLRRPPRAH